MASDVFPRVGITGRRRTRVDLILIAVTISEAAASIIGIRNGRVEGLRLGCGSISSSGPALGDRSVRVELGNVIWIVLELLLSWIIGILLRWWLRLAL